LGSGTVGALLDEPLGRALIEAVTGLGVSAVVGGGAQLGGPHDGEGGLPPALPGAAPPPRGRVPGALPRPGGRGAGGGGEGGGAPARSRRGTREREGMRRGAAPPPARPPGAPPPGAPAASSTGLPEASSGRAASSSRNVRDSSSTCTACTRVSIRPSM